MHLDFFFANIFKKILKSVARLKKMLYLCNNKKKENKTTTLKNQKL